MTYTFWQALKTHLEANGIDPENLEHDELDDLLENTPAGQQIIDIGRVLSEVEVRSPDGRRLEFASIAFSDLVELQRLTLELQCEGTAVLQDLPPEAPRYVVSATFRDEASRAKQGWRSGFSPRVDWSRAN